MSKRLDFTNILNTKNEGLRKRIINTYELNKQDKRDILNNIKSSQNQIEDDVVYVKFNPDDVTNVIFFSVPSIIRAVVDGELLIMPIHIIQDFGDTVELIGASFHLNDILYIENKKSTIKEFLNSLIESNNLKWEDFNFITKEEFYNINM